MDAGAQAIVAFSAIAVGLGTVAVAMLVDEDARFRQVEDLLADPAGHREGTFTIIGVPEASLDDASTRRVAVWMEGGDAWQSEVVVRAAGPDATGVTRWTSENRTRSPGAAAPETAPTVLAWNVAGAHTAFRIHAFSGEGAVWAIYKGVIPEPLEPKPSQFDGRLARALPDGRAVPTDVLVFEVDDYKIGCSSKLVPADAEVVPG